jgi:GNAT superfamily N-acetyltransferase
MIQTTVTYLEMRERPASIDLAPPRDGVTVVRAVHPSVSFYRYLYNTVGALWRWVDRRKLSDERLSSIVQDPRVEVFVLYVHGVPAGYAELDFREPPDIELAYFGIMPEFIGQRLGPFLLRWAIDRAWSHSPRRFWLHTCTHDHPKALRTYQQAGFVVYDTQVEKKPATDFTD